MQDAKGIHAIKISIRERQLSRVRFSQINVFVTQFKIALSSPYTFFLLNGDMELNRNR